MNTHLGFSVFLENLFFCKGLFFSFSPLIFPWSIPYFVLIWVCQLFSWFLFVWYIFFYPNSLNLSVSLYGKWVSGREDIFESRFYIQHDNLCLLISVLRLFIFNVLIDTVRLKSVHLLAVFYLFYLFSVYFCPFHLLEDNFNFFLSFHFIFNIGLLFIPHSYYYFF